VPLIGLTGGIASGKSTVAGRLAQLGAVVVDADQLAREAVTPGSAGLEHIRETFGDDVIAGDGSLDRAALGAIVFGDSDALQKLNRIIHPEVGRLSHARFAAAREADPDAVIVYDVPLLAEARDRGEWDRIVVVHAPAVVRVQRLVEFRGMDRREAERRIAAQASDEQRLSIADDVIESGGTLEQTIERTDALWPTLASAPARPAEDAPPGRPA
jgi:dephospho-CoA kinase